MPIAGTAYSPWLFWDGRKDSQWAQALGPLESAVEHGGTRTQYARVVGAHYREAYEAVFGALPSLDGLPAQAGPVADTTWRAAWSRIPAARQGEVSRLYANIGKASCVNCHNGPRFTDDHFHNTGVAASALVAAIDSGRAVGVRQALAGEFACTSPYSDATPDDCAELRFATTEGEELVRAYKTPSLRGVADRAPYMHAGQLATLSDVVAHYDRAPKSPAGHSELKPLKLSAKERRQIEAFLGTLR
jgi:cytochrome c peroxidase